MISDKRLVRYLKGAIYTIKTVISKTIGLITSSASRPMSTLNIKTIKPGTVSSLTWLEAEPPHGIVPLRAGYGINETLSGVKAGQNGKGKTEIALFARNNSQHLSGRAATLRYTALGSVKHTHTESVLKVLKVEFLDERQDVYCMTVPEAGEFSLANGAIVHNCDAFGLLCVAVEEIMGKPKSKADAPVYFGSWAG